MRSTGDNGGQAKPSGYRAEFRDYAPPRPHPRHAEQVNETHISMSDPAELRRAPDRQPNRWDMAVRLQEVTGLSMQDLNKRFREEGK